MFSSLRAPVVDARTWANTSPLLILSARRCRLRLLHAGVMDPARAGARGRGQLERREGGERGKERGRERTEDAGAGAARVGVDRVPADAEAVCVDGPAGRVKGERVPSGEEERRRDAPGVEAQARVRGLVDDAVGRLGEELGELDRLFCLDDEQPVARGRVSEGEVSWAARAWSR